MVFEYLNGNVANVIPAFDGDFDVPASGGTNPSVGKKDTASKDPFAILDTKVDETNVPAKRAGGNESPSGYVNVVAPASSLLMTRTSAFANAGKEVTKEDELSIIPAAVAGSAVVAVLLLFAIGVPQAVARRYVFSTSGLLSTALERIAMVGSLARLKFKKNRLVSSSGEIYKGEGLYNQLAVRPYLIEVTEGIVRKVQDFDMTSVFEFEVSGSPDRFVIEHVDFSPNGLELYAVRFGEAGLERSAWRLPTSSELDAAQAAGESE